MPPLICTAQRGRGKSPDPSEWFALTQHYARARRLPYESDYGTCIAYCQTQEPRILNDGNDGWRGGATSVNQSIDASGTLGHVILNGVKNLRRLPVCEVVRFLAALGMTYRLGSE